MCLEELIYKRFSEYQPIVSQLATYEGKPAVFYQKTPDDQQKGWEQKGQYPRIAYVVEMQADQERKCAGTMEISLLCAETGIEPEIIEPFIKECVKDLILCPENASPYCFAWSRTDSFEVSKKGRENGADVGVFGLEIRFDILEYPSQETTDPDPIVALNDYIKKIIPEALVLGFDEMGSSHMADAKAPVFYCRLVAIEKSRETNTVAWMDGRIAVHILCSVPDIRLKMIMSLANSLSLDGEVIMLDNSPMFIKRLQVNNRADYLKEGQLLVTVHYGLLRYNSLSNEMKKITVEERR